MRERWKGVVGWPDHSVSDMGRVRREVSYRKWKSGVVKIGYLTNKYRRVWLAAPGKEAVERRVHLLVLESFSGQQPLGQFGRHLNDIKTNNQILYPGVEPDFMPGGGVKMVKYS